jgi:hypothetical protein
MYLFEKGLPMKIAELKAQIAAFKAAGNNGPVGIEWIEHLLSIIEVENDRIGWLESQFPDPDAVEDALNPTAVEEALTAPAQSTR